MFLPSNGIRSSTMSLTTHSSTTRRSSTISSRTRATDNRMKIVNPASGALITDVPEDGAFAVRKKYERARAAQPAWAATSIRKRLDAIRGFREQVVARHETLARTLTQEVGKPIVQSRNELNGVQKRLDFFIAEDARVLHDEKN